VIALMAWTLFVGTAILTFGSHLGRIHPRLTAALALTAPAATLTWVLTQLPAVNRDHTSAEHVSWMPQFGIDLDLRLDALAAVMVLLATGIGVAVFVYSDGYFERGARATVRQLGLLTLFGGAMVGLVLADNLLVLYGFWELTSVLSFLLIGNDHTRKQARDAAVAALLVTGTGGLAMLAGFLMLGHEAGTYSISTIVSAPPTDGTVGVALALILLGAFTKSAQYPFHAWLPGAMVAPTPVSAYLHAATMVKAGVYLVARLAPAYADQVEWWRPVVLTVGLTTMVIAGFRAFHRNDLKVMLAHGTVSQLGFLVAVFGIGTDEAVAAGMVMLLAHGLFKASAFFGVGVVDHQFGTRHIDELPRLPLLRRESAAGWLLSDRLAVAAAASMAGIPFLLGFIAKEGAIRAVLHDAPLAIAPVAIGSVLTAGYSFRFAWGILGRDSTRPVEVDPGRVPPSKVMVVPSVLLGMLTLVGGVWPASLDQLTHSHLSLWHGFDTTLGISLAVISSGAALFAGRRRLLRIGSPPTDSAVGLRPALDRLDEVAERITSFTQPGALPVYAGVILLTAGAAPLWALSRGPGWPGWPQWVETPAHLVVAVMVCTAAIGASASRRRFSAALFLGTTGYAMAGLFVVQGAPDLALTQVAIETLSTVLFVLVLRRLPDRFGWGGSGESAMPRRQRALRVGVAAAVGTAIFILAIAMAAPQPPTPVSDEMVARSVPDGGGANVVNVILVDFRGLDTLGEITVLVSAAIGAVALARAGQRPGQGSGLPPLTRLSRVVTFDVSVRVLFAAVVMSSLYLLFAGHNQPGGGFVGGILAGAAVSLVYLSRGISGVRALSRRQPWTVLGAGLFLSIGTATAPLLWGRPVLSASYVKFHPPLLGTVKLATPTVFDIGVYLVVLGLALMMFESFGDDPSPEVAP